MHKVRQCIESTGLVKAGGIEKHGLLETESFQFEIAQLGEGGALLSSQIVGLHVRRLGRYGAKALCEFCRESRSLEEMGGAESAYERVSQAIITAGLMV